MSKARAARGARRGFSPSPLGASFPAHGAFPDNSRGAPSPEATHDTHVTLTNGHRYVCAEGPDLIIERIAEFRRMAVGAVRRSA
ncbi:MAG: flagellar FlbD family protein [Dehalococcoidia bacterium]|nr:flagellar FlbD family protein [Dehalococcoidia bacterium]